MPPKSEELQNIWIEQALNSKIIFCTDYIHVRYKVEYSLIKYCSYVARQPMEGQGLQT